MRNPYHLRAKVDRLWRQANGNAPGYRRLRALNAIVREIFAPNDQARRNHQLYLATDPYDVARHHLRELYDQGDPLALACEPSLCLPLPLGEGWGEGPPSLPEEETNEEDDDPL